MATCNRCGHEWTRDPVLEIPCPTCRARVGKRCAHESPSGHRKSGAFQGLPDYGHKERDLLAASLGHYHHAPCCACYGGPVS